MESCFWTPDEFKSSAHVPNVSALGLHPAPDGNTSLFGEMDFNYEKHHMGSSYLHTSYISFLTFLY